MKAAIVSTGKQLTELQLSKFEKKHGRVIPGPYRDFLLKYNGGDPDPCGFRLKRAPQGISKRCAVKMFLGVDVPEPTLGLDYTLTRFRDRVPANLFPIARDPGGNLICIATEGADNGKVFFWDHEFEAEEGEPPTSRNVYLVADSFDEFLEGLS